MSWKTRGLALEDAGEAVLLLGNGPNRLSPGHSWSDLLRQLQRRVGRRGDPERDRDKPFPLFYEELYLHGARRQRIHESELKQLIARHTRGMVPGEIHAALLDLGTRHVLTTNYDRTLERSLGATPQALRNAGPVTEQRYSLFRRFDLDGRHLWHIHGELGVPGSIMLGYEHYSGYLERMRAYVTSAASYRGGTLPGLVRRLKKGVRRLRSWVDLFFTRDVYILGLELDVVELNLWWLLTYRARTQVWAPSLVRGQIHYLHARGEHAPSGREARKLELLEATGVKPVALPLPTDPSGQPDYRAFYDGALRWLRRRVR